MKKFVCFLLAVNFQLLSAQQIAGTLKGKVISEGIPVEFAIITLLKTSLNTLSDTAGKFAFREVPAGSYQLRISFVGFENFQAEIEIAAKEAIELHVELTPLTAKLREIVVTGTMKEVTKLESVTPVDVYTSKYFQRNPVNNVFDALYQLNGIFADVDNGVSNTTDVQINGLEGNYTMVLIDGVPAMNGLAGIFALSSLPMSMVDKIEILKGASSTLYGSEAIAGVINIKTKRPLNTPQFAANVSLTSLLETNADITASFRIKKVRSIISASTETVNYRWDVNSDNFTDIPLVNRAGIYNKWSIERKNYRTADIYARYLFEDRFAGEMQLPSYRRGSDSLYGEAITTHQWQAGLQYQLPVNEKALLQMDYSEHYQDAYFGSKFFRGLQRTAFAQLSWNKRIDDVNELLLGVCYRFNYYSDNTGLSLSAVSGYRNPAHIVGVFMEDEISFSPNHKLLTGVRFDYSNRGGPAITPRLNYKWNSKDQKNVLRIGAGTAYRIPNLLNEGFGVMNGSRRILVEEVLKPERAVNTFANYTRVQNVKGGVLSIDANVFYTYFFNFINPDYSDPQFIIYKNNTLGTTSAGFNLNADFTFNYPLKIGVGITYVHTYEIELDVDGEREKEIALHTPPFVANFFFSYNFPAPQLTIDWTGNLISPMFLSTVPDDYRPKQSPWFSIQNIQLTKKFTIGIEIYAGIKNIFNFIQKEPILRPFDPFNRQNHIDNPNNYTFDTTYGFTSTQGIKGFAGIRYTLR